MPVLRSMTSYGRGLGENANFKVLCEIRGVNSRYFDAKFFLPSKHIAVEPRLRKLCKNRVSRGRLEVFFRYDNTEKHTISGELRAGLSELVDEMKVFAEEKEIGLSLSAGDLLKLLSYVNDKKGLEEVGYEEEFKVYETALLDALEVFLRVKEEEGLAMKSELRSLLQKGKILIHAIEKRAPELVDTYKERLCERVEKLLAGREVNELSLINEVSIIADRTDVREEIVRFLTHLEKFAHLIEGKGALGKNLDFLAQEMHREVNTIGSKTQDVEISAMVVELKSVVEQIREQVQNIE